MAFASGKHSKAMCPRCGYKVFYKELKQEWTGYRVCPDCYDPKHPQLTPHRNLHDPQALKDPRPDSDVDGGDATTTHPDRGKILSQVMTIIHGS